jgi:hypothetical protein
MSQPNAQLTQEDGYSIRAATAPIAIALQNWNELLVTTEFQQINPNTQRLAPMIYHHLKDQGDLTERERLRGAYKYAWAKNLRMLNSLNPVFIELHSRSINYRVIKGIAVQLELGFVGARVVGDVDILVSQNEIEIVRQILEAKGFRCNSRSTCSRHSSSAPFEALNFNLGDNHVDVHVAELKDPKALLLAMLDSAPNVIENRGTPIQVPSPEFLLLHSAFHGHQASSDTDLVQAIADISLLAPNCDPRKLSALARQTKSQSDLWHVAAEAKQVDIVLPEIDMLATSRSQQLMRNLSSGFKASSSKVGKVPAIVRDRYRGNATLAHVFGQFPGRRASYAVWLGLGQFSAVERSLMSKERGFLQAPPKTCLSGTTLMPFGLLDSDFVTSSNLAAETLDYRFAVRIDPRARELVLTLNSEFLDSSDAFVYSNGRPITRIVAGDKSYGEITVRNPARVNEISIRPTARVCAECFTNLADLKVGVRWV